MNDPKVPREPELDLSIVDHAAGEPTGGGNWPRPRGNRPLNGDRPFDPKLTVARCLLGIFGICLFGIIYLMYSLASNSEQGDSLTDIVGFYGSIVSMLGTLMGSVVAFYFTRSSSGGSLPTQDKAPTKWWSRTNSSTDQNADSE